MPDKGVAQRALLGTNMAEVFAAADNSTSRIAATYRFRPNDFNTGLLWSVLPSLPSIPNAGFGQAMNPEAVMRWNPDLVLADPGQIAHLKAFGFPHLVSAARDPKLGRNSRLLLWDQMARLTGNEARGARLRAAYEKQRQELVQLVSKAPHRPRVLLVMGGYQRGMWLGGARHINMDRFIDAGGDYIAVTDTSSGMSNIEQIILSDPDMIFLESSGTGDLITPEQAYTRKDWQMLRAVRERRVYKMPDLPLWITPLEDRIRLQWIAEILYPDLVPRRARQDVTEAYVDMFGYRPSKTEIDRVLRVNANRESVNGARFAAQVGEQ
jgi:iron complex transport system substrate-binding protein